jgi:hypothetical protein
VKEENGRLACRGWLRNGPQAAPKSAGTPRPPSRWPGQGAAGPPDAAHYTTEVARPGLTEVELRAAKRSLIAATSRRDNLQLSSETTSGSTAYLADVDADQVDAQITTLDAAIQAVTAHKDTLSS